MAEPTPNLKLTLVEADQAQKHVTLNEALLLLDAVVQLNVISRTLTEPDTSPEPQEGDRYIVPIIGLSPDIAEEWEGENGNVAILQDGVWQFIIPQEGWVAYVRDDREFVQWDGLAWGAFNFAIAPGSVSNAELADMAEATVKGRASGAGAGAPVDLVASQLNTILGIEIGTWTPVVAFATPGTSTWVVVGQEGYFVRCGDLVFISYFVTSLTPTIGTGSGDIEITGLPFAALSASHGNGWIGNMSLRWNWPAGVSHVAMRMGTTTKINIIGSGTGIAPVVFGAAHMSNTLAHNIRFSFVYQKA